MHKQSLRVVVVLAVAIATALAGADRASAAGAVSISECGPLSEPNTTYKLTTDVLSLGNCLVVANNKITIDLQGHSINSVKGFGAAITDLGATFDVITVKNGTVIGYDIGVNLGASTRPSVLGVTAKDNDTGIVVGPQGLVKSSEVSGSLVGIQVGDRSQV
jgi:hypothetical protein